MHAIHLNLQNSIFIAMCKCTVLFLNIVLKEKEIYHNIYFAPETDLYLQVGDRGGDNKMSTLSPTTNKHLPPECSGGRCGVNVGVDYFFKKPCSRSCDTLIMKSPMRSYWLMMSM